MKACVVILGFVGCMAEPTRTPPIETFPVGTYTNCARGVHTRSGNLFPNVAGFESGAILTLAQSGTVLRSTYVDQNGVTQSLGFAVTSGTSATLSRQGQVIPGFTSICVNDLENNRAYPANLTAAVGVMTYSGGMIFVAVTGGLQSDAGPCGTQSDPEASFWLVCEDRQGGEPPSVDPGPALDSQLPVGSYACTSQVETYDRIDGLNYYASGGGTGTLTLTADGASVTAAYGDDESLAGTLRLSSTTPMTAAAERGQTLMAPCMIGGPSRTPEALAIAASSLTLADSTLFLSMAGTMGPGSACPGAQVAGSIICSREGRARRLPDRAASRGCRPRERPCRSREGPRRASHYASIRLFRLFKPQPPGAGRCPGAGGIFPGGRRLRGRGVWW